MTETVSHYEQEKERYLNAIQQSDNLMQKIIANNYLGLANNEQLQKINDLKDKNTRLKHKLLSNEFEIAIVGLEKAGKSTFANALIDNFVLPAAPERCTFTATRLVSGDDKAKVQFYTEDEFNSIFREMMKEIYFPNWENAHFKQVSLEEFNHYFDELEEKSPEIYKSHLGKTDEEIREILINKNKLVLSGNEQYFHGEELVQDTFQSYIRGDKHGEKTDVSKPLSVKSIEIESSKLKQMENAVIYDVPGFDSPTQLHMRQTEERLKKADAIILVTNAGRNPSIQGTSLSVITKHADEDGIALKDKLFVFGNQIDLVNNSNELHGNERILRNDVAKYKIGEDKRVFVGAAKKYLVLDKSIVVDNEYQCRYDISSGIEEIRTSLTHYYETERFAILKRKIDTNLSQFKKILAEIEAIGEVAIERDGDESYQKGLILRQESKNIEKRIKDSLKQFIHDKKEEIYREEWLSVQLKNGIEFSHVFSLIDDETFTRTQIHHDESIRQDIAYEQINTVIRSQLHKKTLAGYIDLVKDITGSKCDATELELRKAFTTAVAGNSVYSEAIESRCIEFLNVATQDVRHNAQRFTYLVERFSRGVFDILLEFPIGNNDRSNRFTANQGDMMMLDHYYSENNGGLALKMLTQRDGNSIALSLKDYASQAATAFKVVAAESAQGKMTLQAMEILKSLYNLGVIIKGVKEPEKLVIESKAIRAQTKEEVISEINQDIENLKDILIKAVIPAVGLELAFVNSLDKQIKLVLAASDGQGSHHNLFDKFIAEIVPMTRHAEFENITAIIEQQKMKHEILNDLKQFLS